MMARGKSGQSLVDSLPGLKGKRVVVVGDVFLDEYIVGRATRLSREAPIPVLEFSRHFFLPGGAANPAHNIRALGGVAQVVGVIGEDHAGTDLLSALAEAGIQAGGVVRDPTRPTTTKIRVIGESSLLFPQQVARVDRLDRRPVEGSVEESLLEGLERLVPMADAVLVSDYRTGVASEKVTIAARRLATQHGKLATVDSQGDLHKYRGYDLVKCNQGEAERVLDRSLRSDDDYLQAGNDLLADLGCGAVVITRGAEGMSLVGADLGHVHVPAANRSEVYDVTGAGDTVIGVATLALCAGIDLLGAARLANYAAGLVVRKLGNAVVSQEELAWAIANW